MTPQRYAEIELDCNAQLTQEEREQGWHFCPDWDYMLVGPETPAELQGCCCKG